MAPDLDAIPASPNGKRRRAAHPEKAFLEFFAGIGLVAEGLRPSSWSCVYANDINPRKLAMHESRNGKVDYYHLGDVSQTAEVIARVPGRPFLATASFPCIDLSLAGHYRGLDGSHSSTFFAFVEVLRALEDRRPRLVMLENVVGFLTSRGGRDFAAAAGTLAGLGYWLDAFVLDARCFTPQSRPRVFVVGMVEALRPRQMRPIDGSLWAGSQATSLRPARVLQLMRTLELPTGWAWLDLPDPPARRITLEECIDLDDGQEWWDHEQLERHHAMMSEAHRQRVDSFVNDGSRFVGTAFRRVRRDGQRMEVRFDGLAGCLRTPRGGSGRQIVVAVGEGRLRMRWMSPREYARLQGVGDFPVDGARNQLLWGLADAVCVPAIRWIDKHVLSPLYERTCPERRNGRVGVAEHRSSAT